MRSWRLRDERGSLTIEAVLVLPLCLSLVFLGTQAAMWFHAREVAMGAAADGARAAAVEQAGAGDGRSAALAFVADAGGSDVLSGVGVASSRSATTATVTVSGASMSLVPGWDPKVTQSASVPVERITG